MSFFLQMLHFPSNVASIFSAIKNNSSTLFFNSSIIYFGQKQPIKVQIFEIFECSIQNLSNSSCRFWIDKSIPLQFLHHFSLSWHKTPMEILSSYIFNFRQKHAFKVPIWRLSSAVVKICQIPHVNFCRHNPVFLQTLYQSCVQSNITPLYYFSWNIIYFGQNQPIKLQIFEIFECSGQKLLNYEEFRQFRFNFCIILHCHNA